MEAPKKIFNKKEYDREYYKNNKIKISKRMGEWRLNNKQKIASDNKIYQINNRDKLKIINKRYRQKDPAREREKCNKWQKANPLKVRISSKKTRFKRYGSTYENYQNLFILQNGKCAICNNEETIKKGNKIIDLSFDHNHITNTARELLCHRCNVALGLIRENPITVKNMLNYLEKWDKYTIDM